LTKKRTLDVLLKPGDIAPERIRGKTIVVVDVLRASTSIVTALAHGAKKVIPCSTVEEAWEAAKSEQQKDVLLCGERSGKRISGFDLGNSPLNYSNDHVRGKTIVFTSTNGSQMISIVKTGDAVIIGGFINSQAVVEFIIDSSRDCLFACSGSEGRFSLEDTVCAGMMIQKIEDQVGEDNIQKTDEALTAQILYQHHSSDLDGMIRNCQHGKYLQSIGFAEDLKLCISVDTLSEVPILQNDEIVPLNR